MKNYKLGDCCGNVIAESTDIEAIYKVAIFRIVEEIGWYDPEEFVEVTDNFRTEVEEYLENKRTFASCLDICEIYDED